MANRIEYVVCRQRVGIDVDKWVDQFAVQPENLTEDVRNYVLEKILESNAALEGAIVGARRDRL